MSEEQSNAILEIDGLRGDVRFFRRDGKWHVMIYGPKWLITDLEDEMIDSPAPDNTLCLRMGSTTYREGSAAAAMLLSVRNKK